MGQHKPIPSSQRNKKEHHVELFYLVFNNY
jgi:hypothetical protein